MVLTLSLVLISVKYQREFKGLYIVTVLFDVCLLAIAADIIEALLPLVE